MSTAVLACAKLDPSVLFELEQAYARYAQRLDNESLESWPELFTQDCRYRLIPRENFAAGLPLATMAMDGVGMLRDRIHAVTNTIYHQPYRQRHVIGRLLVEPDGLEAVRVEANYAVFRTKRDGLTEVLNVGEYKDRLVRSQGEWLFAEKICVFDSELIPNSIIYPL